MPRKCIFVMVCENPKCENDIKCTRNALKSGYCKLHNEEGAGGGPGIETNFNENILIPYAGPDPADGHFRTKWLGTQVKY